MVSFNLYTLIAVAGLVCAFQLGRMYATDKKKWKPGAIKNFGWAAWQPILYGILGVSALLTVLGDDVRARIPFMSSAGFGGGFGGAGGAYGY